MTDPYQITYWKPLDAEHPTHRVCADENTATVAEIWVTLGRYAIRFERQPGEQWPAMFHDVRVLLNEAYKRGMTDKVREIHRVLNID